MLRAKKRFLRRSRRVANKIRGDSEKPRLCIKKSLKYIYAQAVDDTASRTLLSLTTLSKNFVELKSRKNIEAAKKLGEHVAKALAEKGIKKVVFDRRGYKYHGVVKMFAETVRAAGIEF